MKAKLKIKLAISCFCILSVSISVAQVSGIFIVDTLNKIPVQNAFIQSSDFKFTAIADENGFVSLNKISQNISVKSFKKFYFSFRFYLTLKNQ